MLFRNSPWDIYAIDPPWQEGSSLFEHIKTYIKPGEKGLMEGGETLPDEDKVRRESGLSWIAGGLDGAFGHHAGPTDANETAQILRALRALTKQATHHRARALYALLLEHNALEYVDPLIEAVVNDNSFDPDRLHAISRWLATEAPDREPVKAAIALLGVFTGGQDRDLLLTLGRHEEFTLYVVVALLNTENNPEVILWELAQHVMGWGRIHIIERLAETNDTRIKAWMLREGYRNDVMYEYTAYICATSGDLLGALQQPDPDHALLEGAGEIITALVKGRGGPAEGIGDYADGVEATRLYLQHMRKHDLKLNHFVHVNTIRRFLHEEEGEVQDPVLGWPQEREEMLVHTDAILSRSGWTTLIHDGLASHDNHTFAIAAEAAKALGIDTWEVYFGRLKRSETAWYFVMQTDDTERIDRVIALAEQQLALDEIATGPAEELGLGPAFKQHSALDFVLQDLRRFPGRGWVLIRTGLQSPVIRNRNMAARALAAWDRAQWPEEARELLKTAIEQEPNEDTRDSMRRVLAGEPFQ